MAFIWRCTECKDWGTRAHRLKKWAGEDFDAEHLHVHDKDKMKIYKIDGRKYRGRVQGKAVEYESMLNAPVVINKEQANSLAESACLDKDWMYGQ